MVLFLPFSLEPTSRIEISTLLLPIPSFHCFFFFFFVFLLSFSFCSFGPLCRRFCPLALLSLFPLFLERESQTVRKIICAPKLFYIGNWSLLLSHEWGAGCNLWSAHPPGKEEICLAFKGTKCVSGQEVTLPGVIVTRHDGAMWRCGWRQVSRERPQERGRCRS